MKNYTLVGLHFAKCKMQNAKQEQQAKHRQEFEIFLPNCNGLKIHLRALSPLFRLWLWDTPLSLHNLHCVNSHLKWENACIFLFTFSSIQVRKLFHSSGLYYRLWLCSVNSVYAWGHPPAHGNMIPRSSWMKEWWPLRMSRDSHNSAAMTCCSLTAQSHQATNRERETEPEAKRAWHTELMLEPRLCVY